MTINVGDLNDLIVDTSSGRKAKKTHPEIDLDQLGYRKILGKGQITRPVLVRVKACSKEAKRKIEDSGGKIILTKVDTKT
jgi:large subunit ribosomal protein L15